MEWRARSLEIFCANLCWEMQNRLSRQTDALWRRWTRKRLDSPFLWQCYSSIQLWAQAYPRDGMSHSWTWVEIYDCSCSLSIVFSWLLQAIYDGLDQWCKNLIPCARGRNPLNYSTACASDCRAFWASRSQTCYRLSHFTCFLQAWPAADSLLSSLGPSG